MKHQPDAAPRARRSRLAPPLRPAFFDRATADVARDMLGAVLECRAGGVVARGRIVEVEAYLGPHDAACHAAVGLTRRNRNLHGPPGTAYVYRIYGLHWCVNAVTRESGHGSAVLVRALEPMDGIEVMRGRRGGVPDRELTNGPGKLCQALGITGEHDGVRLDRGALRLCPGIHVPDASVVVTPRIGITQAAEWPLRYCIAGNPHVSRAPSQLPRLTLAQAAAWLRARGLR